MKFSYYLNKTNTFAEVYGTKNNLVKISLIEDLSLYDLILFENNSFSYVFEINEDFALCVLLDQKTPNIKSKAVKIGDFLSVKMPKDILGKIIDPLGRDLKTGEFFDKTIELKIDVDPPVISERQVLKQPLHSGVLITDFIIPLAKGQRELIIGGKKTGKTTFTKMLSLSHKESNEVLIYCLIGKRNKELNDLILFLKNNKILEKSVIIASLASDSPGLINIAPFTALTIAEYFKNNGKDSIVFLDDLSIHSKSYRELSLFANRPPGRESYPGDIFYIHAKLLERAGNFIVLNKEVSITCFPIVETFEDDVTGFISTNLMSITDGHIFFDTKLYSEGKRPAINPYLSVTRVGKQIQTPLKREITMRLLSLITHYERAKNMAHLSTELSPETQKLITIGKFLDKLFQQFMSKIFSEIEEIIIAGLIFYKIEKNDELELEIINNQCNKIKQNITKTEIQKLLSVQTIDQLTEVIKNLIKQCQN
ncbi:MAG: ATP synthase subunit alpha [Patescibacteria group bacterium]|nr:MAG: ATP synthase subunit alpha [Patescibacteria group bacterium]